MTAGTMKARIQISQDNIRVQVGAWDDEAERFTFGLDAEVTVWPASYGQQGYDVIVNQATMQMNVDEALLKAEAIRLAASLGKWIRISLNNSGLSFEWVTYQVHGKANELGMEVIGEWEGAGR